jgi:hypothetical protein
LITSSTDTVMNVGDRPSDVGGQALGQFRHAGLHAFARGERVGAGAQLDRHAGHRLAVQFGAGAVILRAQFDAADIGERHGGPVRIGLQDDVFELLRVGEAVLRDDRGVQLAALCDGLIPQRTAGGLAVLFLDGGERLGRGQLVGGELVRIEPDAHGVRAAEQADVAHAGDAAQFVDDLVGRDVAEFGAVRLAALGSERHDLEEAGIGFADEHALATDFLR